MKKIIETIFSVKNSQDKIYKIWTIVGIKLKFKKRQSNIIAPVKNNDDYRFIELNKQYFKVKNHWFWDEYNRQGWEPQTYNTYKYFLTPETSYVDIGAWIGITIFFAAELGAEKIFAVEANPLSFELVKENCSMNKLTENVQLSNLCITDKDNTTVGFGGINNEINTSSSSSIRGDKWQIPSKKITTYLKENNLTESEDLFIKIDIEGAEELILEDIEKLSQKDNLTIYLSLHPPFMKNKQEACKKLLGIYSKFKYTLDSSLQLLTKEKLEEMILADEKYPSWGTLFGNFFEITLSNKSFDYKKYWLEDNCKNIIPLIGTEFPEGWNAIEVVKDIIKEYPHESVIDFGCGYGRLSKSFDKEKYFGIDINPKAIQLAKENNPDYKYQEFCVDSSFPEADLCIAYTVFLHLDDITLKSTLEKLTKNIKQTFIISEILGHEWRRHAFPLVFNREKDEYIEIMNKFGFEFNKEIRKPYKRYAESKEWNEKNTDISFLIFRKMEKK